MPAEEDPDEESLRLLHAARDGDIDALAELIERYRGLLINQANRELDTRLKVRAGASDVYQRTCLSAVNRLSAFRGKTIAEFVSWLKQLNHHNLLDVIRDHKAAGIRSLEKEQAIDQLPGKGYGLGDQKVTTPSKVVAGKEGIDQIHRTIATLPDHQATAVRLKVVQQKSIQDIAQLMNRSQDSVASLLKRGLKDLRERLQASQSDHD